MQRTSRDDSDQRISRIMGAGASRPERHADRANGDSCYREAPDLRDEVQRSPKFDITGGRRSGPFHGAAPDVRPFHRRERDSSPLISSRPAQPAPTALRSPSDMRHSFQRERRDSSPRSLSGGLDDFSFKHARRRTDICRSNQTSPAKQTPHQWTSEPMSPPRKRPSSPQGQESSSGSRWPAAGCPRSSTLRYDGDIAAPRLSKLPAMKSTPTSQPGAANNSQIGGLKNVPTGPSQQTYTVEQSIKRQPHLFVSSTNVPANPATISHIRTLMRFMKPTSVHMDDTGYFIIFPNTIEGRIRLRQCAEKYRDTRLFGQHLLNPTVFENGQSASKVQENDFSFSLAASQTPFRQDQPVSGLLQPTSAYTKNPRWSAGKQQGETDDVTSLELRTDATSLHPTNGMSDPNAMVASDPVQPFLASTFEHPSRLHASSPALATLGEKDDSASVLSGTTASSRSRAVKCHVCQGLGGTLALTKCTTCSRRFHRQCLPSGSDISKEEARWQCERCKKKGVPFKRSISDTDDGKSGTKAGEARPDEPLRKKLREASEPPARQDVQSKQLLPSIGELEAVVRIVQDASKSGASQHEAALPPGESELPAQEGELPTPENDGPSLASTGNTSDKQQSPAQQDQPNRANPSSTTEDPLDEAHALVEQSFGQVQGAKSTEVRQAPKSSGIFTFVKKKRAPEQLPNGVHNESAGPDRDVQPSTDTSQVCAPASLISPVDQQTQAEISGSVQQPSMHEEPLAASELPFEQSGFTLPTADRVNVPETPTVENDTNSVSPADIVLQAQLPQKRSFGKGKPTRLTIVNCTSCRKVKVALKPSGSPICQECKKAAFPASNSEAPAQAELNDIDNGMNSSSTSYGPAALPAADIGAQQVEPNESATDCHSLSGPGEQQGQAPAYQSDVPIGDSVSAAEFPADRDGHGGSSKDTQLSRRRTIPSTPRNNKFAKHQSQRVEAIDEYDLGNSFLRPKSTYTRLIALALNAAPHHVATASAIVQWVDENIPGYEKGQGQWAAGLQASMKLNASGRSGRQICEQITVSVHKGQELKAYSLLPGLSETLEHWDYILQQPRPPLKMQRHSDVHSGATTVDEQSQPLKKPGKLRTLSKKRSAQTQTDNDDNMDVDEQFFGKQTVSESESSDDEPLSNTKRRNQDGAFSATSDTSISPPAEYETDDSMDVDNISSLLHLAVDLPDEASNPSKSRLDSTSRGDPQPSEHSKPQEGPSADSRSNRKEEEDDQDLLALILKKNQDVEYSTKSLYETWLEYDPKNQVDTAAKIAEIAKRPTRKQLFGKPAFHSPLGPQPFLRVRAKRPSSTQASPSKRTAKRTVSDHDATTVLSFDNLDEFLGLTDDLIPVVHEKQLAFKHRNGQRRLFYKTGF